MDNSRLATGRHRLPVRPIVRKKYSNGVDMKRLPECIIDEPMIRPVVKATDLRVLLGHDEPPAKRLKHWKKQNYKIGHREIPQQEEMLEQRVIEVPGEDLRLKLPLGVICYRVEHQGFEYLLYLDGDTGSLKFFEKRFL